MKRIALLSGMFTLVVLDLLALEDITTTSDWTVEVVFLIASIPVLLTFAHYLRRDRRASERKSQEADAEAEEPGLLGRSWRQHTSERPQADHSELRR